MLPLRGCCGRFSTPSDPLTPDVVEVDIFESQDGSKSVSSQDEFKFDAEDPNIFLHTQFSSIELQLARLADGQRSMTDMMCEILQNVRHGETCHISENHSTSTSAAQGVHEASHPGGRPRSLTAPELDGSETAKYLWQRQRSLSMNYTGVVAGHLHCHRCTSPVRTPALKSSSTLFSLAGPRSMPAGTKDQIAERRRKWIAVGQVQTSSPDQYKDKGCARQLLRSSKFESLSLCVIICNAIWLGVDTDMNKADVLVHADVQYQIVEHAFCAYYVVEWLIRFAAFKSFVAGLHDLWFAFDTFLVTMTVVEVWVMSLVVLATNQGGTAGIYSASALKILRLFRLTRLSRVVRLLRSLPELVFMLHGVAAATRSVGCTLGMLFGTVYVYGIAFTQLSQGTQFGAKYFPTVLDSMYTLVLDGAFMDSTKLTMDAIRNESIFCAVLFGLVILTANLTIMNLLIGVLCDVVTKVSAKEKEEMDYDSIKDKLSQILRIGGLGEKEEEEQRISKDDFFNLVQNEQALELLEKAGVNTVVLLDFADSFFQSDKLGRKFERRITFEEFVELIMKLRQGNAAALRDVAELRRYVRDECLGLKLTLAVIKEGQQRLEAKIDKHKQPGLARETCLSTSRGRRLERRPG